MKYQAVVYAYFYRMFLVSVIAILVMPLKLVRAESINVVTEYFDPFQIKLQDGTLAGASVDIAKALFRMTGDQPITRVLPWARAYQIGQHEKNTMIYSLARTAQRAAKFHWIGKVRSERFFVWGLKSRFKQGFDRLEQIKPYTIAISNQYSSDEFLVANQFQYVEKLVNDNNNIDMLFKRRVDLLLSTELNLKKNIKKCQRNFLKVIKLYEIEALHTDLSIAFSLDTDPQIVSRFRHAYAQLLASGEFEQIRQQWHITDDK